MVTLGRPAVLTAALLALASCTSRVGTLIIDVTRSPASESREPLDGIASSVRLRVDGPDFRIGPLVVPFDRHAATIEDIPIGDARQVTLEGLDAEGHPVSRGHSCPFRVAPGDNAISIFVGLTGTRGEFSPAPAEMSEARAFHTATLLTDGCSVLLTGGTTDHSWRPDSPAAPASVLASSERIDGSAALVMPGQAMNLPRIGHSATLLPSGNVLLAGGSNNLEAGNFVELYQPGTGLFQRTNTFMQPQFWHQAALLPDLRVAMLGGTDLNGSLVQSPQVYADGAVATAFPNLKSSRRAFTLTTLADGRLLAIGGFDDSGNPLGSVELLKPQAPAWEPGPALTVPRAHHTATLLTDGTLLVVGGLTDGGRISADIERCAPAQPSCVRTNAVLKTPRWGHTATLLADGRVLVAGGYAGTQQGSPTRDVEAIIVGESQINAMQLGHLHEARAGHTAVRVGSGDVVIAGGNNGSGATRSVEIFVY